MEDAGSEDRRIALPEVMDLAAAHILKEQFLEASEAPRLALAGAPVARVTTPALQVLIAAARTRRAAGRTLVLETPSDVLARAIAELGLDADLPSGAH